MNRLLPLVVGVLFVSACSALPENTPTVPEPTLTAVPTQTPTAVAGHANNVWDVAWSPDGATLATGDEAGGLVLWDAKTGSPLAALEGHSACVVDVAWSPDSRTLVSGDQAGTVIVWDPSTRKQLHTVEGDGVSLSPMGETLASWPIWSRSKNVVTLWNLQTGEPLCTLGIASDRPVLNAVWSPDGTELAHNVLLSGGIHIWDTQTCKRKQHLWQPTKSYISSPYSLAWSPDGTSLAVGTYDGPVLLWDIAQEKVTSTSFVHDRAVQSIGWSPDGERFATGAVDGTVIVWDAGTGDPIHTLAGHPWVRPEDGPRPDPPANPSGYRDGPTNVAWSPDGKVLATSGFASSRTTGRAEAVRLWDVKTGQLVSVIK